MNDKQIKMIALDLDGTTLNKQGKFAPRTIEAFRRAMEKGVHIVISTGRAFHSLPEQLFEIDGLEYVVTSNGAQVTELASREIIYKNYISCHAVETVVKMLKGTGTSVETFVEGRAYIDKAEYEDYQKNGSNFRDVGYVLRTRNPIQGICDYMIDNKNQIENISLNFEFNEEKEKMRMLLNRIDDITVTSSFAHNFEIGGSTTSKGEALRFLMERLVVVDHELMACGDSLNDSQMLRLAGIGVAVENATEDVKNIADYITDSNDNDGVAKAIEKLVL